MEVIPFVETEYLPHVISTLSASTVAGYKKLWRAYRRYVEPSTLEMRPCEAQNILRSIALNNPHLGSRSLSHTKALFSGIWSFAVCMGVVDSNPWRMVKLPKAHEPGETTAYSPGEVAAMMKALPPPYDLLILFFACSGCRKSEVRGAQWGDFSDCYTTLSIARAVWGTVIKDTKTRASRANIPIVPELATRLAALRGKAAAGAFVFHNRDGRSLDLDNACRRIIVPALKKAGISWSGFHGFRRGLATILHSRSVPDKEIQRILRHSDLATTMRCYVKALPESTRAAMAALHF